MVPKAVFTVSGEIADFTRADNLYRTMKRETEKLLKNWSIDFKIDYSEKEGEIHTP